MRGIHRPHPLKDFENFCTSFPLAEVSPKTISADIIKCEPVPNALLPCIRRGQTVDMPLVGPHLSMHGPKFDGTEFVKADYMSSFGNTFVKFIQPFFFVANSGSFDSFHVFVRCSLIPFECRIIRNVSMLMDLTTLVNTRYSLSFSSDHTV